MPRNFLKIIGALIFYTVFTLAVFWDPIVNGFGSIQWDAIGVHFFNLFFSSDAWHSGTLPLWTPYIFNGFPQIADLQVAVFYPINLIIGLFSVFSADLMLYQAIFHYFLAGFFAFLLSRHLSENFLISLGIGAAYAFGGFMTGHGSHIGMLNTASWLPLIFLFLLLALNKRKISYAVFCGFLLGVAILAGHFQIALYIAFVVGLYFIFDFIWQTTKSLAQKEYKTALLKPLSKKLAIVLTIYIIAFLISAIQLLPTYELTKQSQRAQISLEMSQTESLHPQSLWALVYPNYNNVSHGDAYQGPWDRTQNYLYISITILVLAAIGAATGIHNKNTRKMTIFFILLAVISILYSLGQYGFLQKYFYQFIPFFDKIRAPSNMILLFNLAIIGLAAIAGKRADTLLNHQTIIAKLFWVAILLMMSAEIFNAALQNELLYARKNSSDILREPWIAQNILSEYSALDEIDKFRVFKIPEFADNQTQMRQIYAFDGYNPLALSRYGNFVDTMVKNANLVDLAGIKYLPCQYMPARAEKLEKVGNLCINKNYFPRAFFVQNYIVADNPKEALVKLNEINPKETIILEEEPEIKIVEVEPRQVRQNVIITDARPGFWKLNTTNDNDSFLFFGQTDYPGWVAKIDDAETKIYKANYLFQAILVPAGRHEIIFEFQPIRRGGLKTGVILTIIGLIITVVSSLQFLVFEYFMRKN